MPNYMPCDKYHLWSTLLYVITDVRHKCVTIHESSWQVQYVLRLINARQKIQRFCFTNIRITQKTICKQHPRTFLFKYASNASRKRIKFGPERKQNITMLIDKHNCDRSRFFSSLYLGCRMGGWMRVVQCMSLHTSKCLIPNIVDSQRSNEVNVSVRHFWNIPIINLNIYSWHQMYSTPWCFPIDFHSKQVMQHWVLC